MTDDDFMASIRETMQLGMKVKAALTRKGKQSGWTRCPECGGKVRAVLAGRRQHLHMSCETAGCIQMME